MLHDALRPNFGADLLLRVLTTARPGQGSAPAVRAGRTLGLGHVLAGAHAAAAGENLLGPKADHRLALFCGPCDAGVTYIIQSPQAYARADYLHAVEQTPDNAEQYADATALVHAAGHGVALVRGRLENMRLDGPDELRILQKLMGTGPRKKEKYTGLGW